MTSLNRMRMPTGFSGFRPDLGAILKARRKDWIGKQQTLADAIGITRPSLSAIENGHALPLPDTLEGLMRELSLNWVQVAVRGETDRVARPIDHTPRANHRQELGRWLRKGRRIEGLTLRNLAERCNLSAAQLSRIERGDVRRGRAYEDHPDDMKMPSAFRRIQFADPELRRLSMLDG